MNQEPEEIGNIKKEYFIPLFVLFLLVLNCSIKFYGIDYSSFWIDEAYSVSMSLRNVTGIIGECAATDNPPFYFLLLHFWTSIFGISEFAVRSMSAVFSVAAALVLFFYAKKQLGTKATVIVSLIFSVSAQHLFYAQETRNYGLVFLLVLISAKNFTDLYSGWNLRTFVLLTLANILITYTHFIAGFLIACEGILALLFIRANRKFFIQIVLSSSIVIVCILPWLLNILNHIPVAGKFWLEKPTFYNFKGLYIDFANNKAGIVIIFCIILFGMYKFLWKKRKQLHSSELFSAVFFLLWAFFIPVLVYLIAHYRPVFLTRYLLFCSFGLYLSAAFFLMKMELKQAWLICLSFVLIASMAVSLELHPEREERWREAVELVKKIKGNDDVVILSVYYTNNVFSYYFNRDIFRQYSDIEKLLNRENIYSTSKMDQAFFESLPSKGRLILVQSHQVDDDPENTVLRTLSSNARQISFADFNKVKVFVFSRSAN